MTVTYQTLLYRVQHVSNRSTKLLTNSLTYTLFGLPLLTLHKYQSVLQYSK